MSTQLENDPLHAENDAHFQNHLPNYYRAILKDFRRITSSFVTFNLLFSLGLAAEVFLICFFSSFLSRSSIFAFALAALFLTAFSYLILLFYYQAKKPEQLQSLKNQFLVSCRQILPVGSVEHHLSLAAALMKLSAYLQDFEKNFYKIPSFLRPLSHWVNQFSAYCHGEDVFRMKSLLLNAAIEEHLRQIRLSPTDLEVHASLANAYISFSLLYKESPSPLSEKIFRKLSQKAIEEFRILSHYAPNDPWVHEQLAAGYKDLEMADEEIKEVEFLFQLRPQDNEILFRLGSLYFQQGQNAKGLQIYEELKQFHYKRAEELLTSYGSFSD